MIDTITVIINNYNYEDISTLIDGFKNVNIKYRDNGTSTKSGQHKNFLFYLTENSFKATGSIAKLIQDTNQINYDISIVQQAINYLSVLLNIDVSNAKVTRLDFGFNIKLKHPVDNYISTFVKPTCCKRICFSKRGKKGDETTVFDLNGRDLMFYDKVAQLKANNELICSENQNCNILRYEVKLKEKIAKRLNVNEVTFSMLTKQSFNEQLLQIWFDEYTKIIKIYRPMPALDCSLPKKFIPSLAAYGINALGGVDIVLKIIDSYPKVASHNRIRMRNIVKALGANFSEYDSQALIEELNDKIYFIAHNAA